MTNSNPNGINTDVGLRFLADTTNSNSNCMEVDVNIGNVSSNSVLNTGAIRAVKWSGTATVLPSSTQSLQPHIPNFVLSDPYLLTVYGYYNGSGQLDLQATAVDQNPADAADSITTPVDLTNGYITPPGTVGTNFGLYMSTSGNSQALTYTADFGSFSVVPEPVYAPLFGRRSGWLPRLWLVASQAVVQRLSLPSVAGQPVIRIAWFTDEPQGLAPAAAMRDMVVARRVPARVTALSSARLVSVQPRGDKSRLMQARFVAAGNNPGASRRFSR